MPWSKDKVPDQVKGLPQEAKTVWISAANSALKDNDEETAIKIGWTAVKNAGFIKEGDNWVKKKAEPDNYSFEAEIFSTGTWAGDEFTDKDLDNMVYNFNSLKGEVKPFLKLGHNLKQEQDGQPSLGWIDNLKREGSKLIAKFKDVPKIVYDAIKSKRYKRISAEIYFNYKDLSGNIRNKVLRAASLLGADVPEVKDLKDVAVFLSQKDSNLFDHVKEYHFDSEGNYIDTKIITIKGDTLKMDADKEKKYQEDLKAKETALAKEQADKEKAQKQLKEFKEKEAKKAEDTAKEEFKSFCEDKVKNKTMTPGQRDKLQEGFIYSEGKVLVPFESFKTFYDEMEKIVEFKEIGESGENEEDYVNVVNVSNIVDSKAKQVQEKNTKLTYSEAVDVVLEANPKLADKYIKG